MMISPLVSTLACLVSVAALLVVDRQPWPWARVVAKLSASTFFVLAALGLGALGTRYGQCVLVGLLLGWLGDALLLSRQPAAFLAGLGAFLLSHLAFAAAFLSGPVSWGVMAVAALPAVAFGAGVLRWLLPHTPNDFKPPVLAYVVVILTMCVAAAGHAVPQQHWLALLGALLFAASDISVARDRFVQLAYINRLWGWPAYFVAQLLLAWSVTGPVA